jgi:hypothetical protein
MREEELKMHTTMQQDRTRDAARHKQVGGSSDTEQTSTQYSIAGNSAAPIG